MTEPTDTTPPENTPSQAREPSRIGDVLKDAMRRYPSLTEVDPKRDAEIAERHRLERENEARWRRRRSHDELLSSVGRRYERATLDSFEFSATPKHAILQREVLDQLREYAADIEASIRRGRGIVFFGPPGTGKDHLLVAMLRVAIDAGFSIGWINGLDFYGEMRDQFDGDASEASMMRGLERPDVLGLSDPLPPWDKLTAFQASTMFRVIDRRYRQQKPIWTSINVATGKEASERLGAAVVDRLRDDGLSLFCNWPSYRSQDQG